MKPKYITPDNYQQFKPSELVHSFISDIEVAEKIGKPMDMLQWAPSNRCLPCIGGMAALNWGMKIDFSERDNNLGALIAALGNSIRLGLDIAPELRRLYIGTNLDKIEPFELTSFYGKTRTKRQFTALKHQVMLYVKELEKYENTNI